MKQKYLLLTMILFVFLFLFSATSFALIPGDFGSAGGGPPDGVVDFEDLMIFALAYGSTEGDANWNPACDIASEGGILQLDGVIDFEDLMIFAMNYGRTDKIHNLTKDTYYNTIQAALDDADTENFIEVNDGTYDESITFPSGKVITLQSVNGASSTIIRGDDGLNTVTFYGSLTGTTLEGFTITHANGLIGRGVYIIDGNLAINNCTISNNTADYGGGIRNDGDLTITASTICNNSAADHCGGGIENCGSLTITESTISNNTANYGGGIRNYSHLTITESTILNNSAYSQGGGIYNDYDGSLTITRSTISDNTANYGGGIYNKHNGSLTITGSTISNNTANYGGGIRNYSHLTITESTILNNSANQRGGGIYNCYDGTLDITSSTISDNTATYGGGIYDRTSDSGTLTITGSNISGNNVSQQGGGIYLTGTGTITIGGSSSIDTDNFNTFTDNKKDGTISADQHIRDSSGDCRSSYLNNFYNPD